MKSLTLSKNNFGNPLQRTYSGDFDPESVYRKLSVILKIVPEAGYCLYTRENQPIAEKQRRKSTYSRDEK
jgi:hypothetical protein